jgi:hypothetical protein
MVRTASKASHLPQVRYGAHGKLITRVHGNPGTRPIKTITPARDPTHDCQPGATHVLEINSKLLSRRCSWRRTRYLPRGLMNRVYPAELFPLSAATGHVRPPYPRNMELAIRHARDRWRVAADSRPPRTRATTRSAPSTPDREKRRMARRSRGSGNRNNPAAFPRIRLQPVGGGARRYPKGRLPHAASA